MGTPDPPDGERCAELLCLAGWTTPVRAFDVQGRTYWVVWCAKGGNQVAGRGDSRGAARRTAYRETTRARLHSPALSHASFLPDASARTTRGSGTWRSRMAARDSRIVRPFPNAWAIKPESQQV
jgi:hypothetical protein